MGITDYIKKILKGDNESGYQPPKAYKKINCNICDQVCYNQEDLKQHLKYNHPDVASSETV